MRIACFSPVNPQPSGISDYTAALLPYLAERVDEIGESELKAPAAYRYVGRDVTRLDIEAKCDGSAEFGIDVQVPGMVYASILRTPVEGERPREVDDARDGNRRRSTTSTRTNTARAKSGRAET